ncbi:hypothetical protein [Fructilactobacillus florum]|uniref:hypothetical protein n=1 Tax=Fructilactobacillus florum TaxID=640331 RepID=UPI0006CF67CC|nr:hypothetical protein [Fructilactobacillus florum]
MIDHRIHAKLAGLKLNSNDVVLVNYPLYSGAKFSTHLLNYLKEHRVRTIALIHDLDSLRFAWSIFGTLEQEAAYLNQYDYVITHNQRMTAKLQSVGLTTETVELELFDYLSNAKSQTNSESYKNNLTFAGNLNKATFFYRISKSMLPCMLIYTVKLIIPSS